MFSCSFQHFRFFGFPLVPSFLLASLFLPPFPRCGFCSPQFSQPFGHFSTTKALTPLRCHLSAEVSSLTSLTLPNVPPSTTVTAHMSLFPPPQRIRCFSGFALRSEARRCFPLNQVRFLRTTASPPVAPHDASRRRSFHWLQGLWLSLTRTFTVLCKRLYERTNAELQLGLKRGYSVKLGTHRTALQSLCRYERSLGTNISVSGFQIPQEAVECRCWC